MKEKNGNKKRQQGFYLFLMISAYTSTLGFGIFYYSIGVSVLSYTAFIAFALFVVLGLISFFSKSLILLFRVSIVVASTSFFLQAFYSGGALSVSMFEFLIPPLLAFFYRPIRDRYYFMAISGLCLIAMASLTAYGHTKQLIPEAYVLIHNMLVIVFVFTIVSLYSILYRNTLARKNKKLKEYIQELQTTTQKLIQSEKMASLGMMSAGVAHEINNPLNFIKGGIDVLSNKLEKEKDLQPFVKAISEGVNRASSIVNSLGHFSRETNAMDEECDLQEIVDNCLVMLQHKLKYKVEVRKNYSSSKHLKIIGNEGRLHQAILNIIANAEQAIEDKGVIGIEIKAKKNHLRLTITDTGSGIEEEDILKISDPFFTTKPVGKGTGLGLAITYKIVEEHGGKIIVSSEVSKGTQFTVLFELNDRFV